ncbi:hypothetical protein GDO86_015619 [Hymenochirus boettgeri]|uniref:Uncharacterized protein n=1 Tax=Hymenochirus boettgeri TaxID=247094 RepID=A0A8T2JW67_9PIPI|nr:hypothetical protein GDO86_015619 [Hymenochirus boettgeri]
MDPLIANWAVVRKPVLCLSLKPCSIYHLRKRFQIIYRLPVNLSFSDINLCWVYGSVSYPMISCKDTNRTYCVAKARGNSSVYHLKAKEMMLEVFQAKLNVFSDCV